MRDLIMSVLVKVHKTVTTDKYGQVSQFNLTPRVFGDKADDVEKYCRNNQGILLFSTYGGRGGTYRGFVIVDREIKSACSKALEKNENYRRNVDKPWC